MDIQKLMIRNERPKLWDCSIS